MVGNLLPSTKHFFRKKVAYVMNYSIASDEKSHQIGSHSYTSSSNMSRTQNLLKKVMKADNSPTNAAVCSQSNEGFDHHYLWLTGCHSTSRAQTNSLRTIA
ncbi:Uncharacterized protein Fot_34607 [Forsythia ovata]|uniref:Uncharacterized protein n=1 Tax=Forsythia ovata TaxID=205694 RepID=A0ABD1SKM1_9LAMI